MRRQLRFAIACTAVAITAAAAMARQDEDAGQPTRTDTPPVARTTQIVQLEHTAAVHLTSVLQEVAPRGAAVVPDERTNALIIHASAEEFESLMALVRTLDVAVKEEGLRTYRLAHIRASDALASTLSRIFPSASRSPAGSRDRTETLRIALDPSSNQVVATGPADLLDSLGQVLADLDVASAPSTSPRDQMTIRVAWLVSSEDGALGRPAPEDLGGVREELARIGLADLRLAAQSVLRVSSNEEFSTEFIAMLDEAWIVSIEGRATALDGDASRLTIRIRGRGAEASGRVQPAQPGASSLKVADVRTTITTRSGHFVVLGVAPIGDRDSVFVIQATTSE